MHQSCIRVVNKITNVINCSMRTGSKEHLLKVMKEGDVSPVKKGKGCRKRTNNAKYFEESDDDTEETVSCLGCTTCI